MRSFTSATLRKANPTIKTFFDFTPSLADSCKRFYSSPVRELLVPAKFTLFDEVNENELEKFKKFAGFKRDKDLTLDLSNSTVVQFAKEDIEVSEADKIEEIAIIAGDNMTVHYGARGVAASANKSPRDLLKHSLIIPKRSTGVLTLLKHVPFLIEASDPHKSSAMAGSRLVKVPTHEENITRYSLTKVTDLPPETAKIITLRLQQAIFENKKNEYFYEEITSRVYPPSESNRSSGTLMNFENEDNHTTNTHYHPGERSLHVLTTNKASGVTLNFCGIGENPDNRKDCEVKLVFPKNSALILNFSPFTHHKFHGEFVCMSIHPREGDNLIQALESGVLPKGFLETATVFSKAVDDPQQESWHILPKLLDDTPSSLPNISNYQQIVTPSLNKGQTP